MVVGKVKGNPFRSSRLKCIIGSGGFGIPPCMENHRNQLTWNEFKVSRLLADGFQLTRYCNINGSATVGSIFPTTTTVKVDGSLKHLLKYSQALRGSTFCRSLFLIGCKTKKIYSEVRNSLISLLIWMESWNSHTYSEKIRVSIVKLLHTVCKSSIWIPILSTDCFFSHLHNYFHIFFPWR